MGLRLITGAFGVGMGFANTALLIAVQTSVAWEQRGIATASTMFFRTIGGTLAVGVMGGVHQRALDGRRRRSPKTPRAACSAARARASLSPGSLARLGDALAAGLGTVFWIIAGMGVVAFVDEPLVPPRAHARRRSSPQRQPSIWATEPSRTPGRLTCNGSARDARRSRAAAGLNRPGGPANPASRAKKASSPEQAGKRPHLVGTRALRYGMDHTGSSVPARTRLRFTGRALRRRAPGQALQGGSTAALEAQPPDKPRRARCTSPPWRRSGLSSKCSRRPRSRPSTALSDVGLPLGRGRRRGARPLRRPRRPGDGRRPRRRADVLVRVHSECLTSEVFGSLKCDCREQLEAAQAEIARRGAGRGALPAAGGPRHRPRQQDPRVRAAVERAPTRSTPTACSGSPTTRASTAPPRRCSSTSASTSIRLMTNNPEKVRALRALGVDHREPARLGRRLRS